MIPRVRSLGQMMPFLVVLLSMLLTAVVRGDTAAAFSFKRGVNISHWLSQNSAQRTYAATAWFGESDVAWIAQQGFDHIRLPVDVRACLAANGTLDEAKLKPIRDAIAWAQARGLGVVLDAHFLPGADFNAGGSDRRVYTDGALQEKVAGVWRELARRFKDEGPNVRFEILNEPVADENAQVNVFMARVLAVIRETNPTRVVYLTSNKWSSFWTLKDVELPKDPHLALTLHYYEPFVFTHQRAPWAGFKDTMPPVEFPGRLPDLTGQMRDPKAVPVKAGTELTVAEVAAAYAQVAAWMQAHAPGVEVYIGEFGVFRPADDASKKRWIATVVHECESRGWGWAVWDYKGGFAVRGADGDGTAILAGLFPKRE